MSHSFGSMLKILRKKYKLTQEQLAEGVCSIKHLRRIEQDGCEPSAYILHGLSSKLNIDLNEYYEKFYLTDSMEAVNYTKQIIDYMSSYEFDKLDELIVILEKNKYFKDGPNLALLYYCKAMSLFDSLERQEDKASTCKKVISLCRKGIEVEHPNFSLTNYKHIIYSNYEYSMLNLIASCYIELEEYEECEKMLLYLLNNIEDIYFSGSHQNYGLMGFNNRMYQHTLHQLGKLYYSKERYDHALDYVNKAIKFSFKKSLVRLLPDLFEAKFHILYKLEKYEEALADYRCAKNLYLNSNLPEFAIDMENNAKINFPKIIEIDK